MRRLALPGRLALRSLRARPKGWVTVIACLAIGVAAIAASLSLRQSIAEAMIEDASALLGGDLELRRPYRSPDPADLALLTHYGAVSETMDMRAMARRDDGQQQSLVELKAVDGRYPLYGDVVLEPEQSLGAALSNTGGVWGAAVEAELLQRLGLTLGDTLQVGALHVQVRARIVREPDRASAMFALGPRMLIAQDALADTGLIQPGSLIHHLMLLRLPQGADKAAIRATLRDQLADGGWQVRDSAEATPGTRRLLDDVTGFMALTGLVALVVGGIGVANAVRAFLDTRRPSYATLKSVGASRAVILATASLEIAGLTLPGVLLGLVIGLAIPWGMLAAWGDRLPMVVPRVVHLLALGEAAAFGVLVAFGFSVWPVAAACDVPVTALFRGVLAVERGRHPGRWAVVGLSFLAFAVLALVSAPDRALAGWGVAGSLVVAVLLFILGSALHGLLGLMRHISAGAVWRIALAGLHRPGAPIRWMVLSLGLGLTLLVTVALVQADLGYELKERLPDRAPTFFFIDIQGDQKDRFDQAVTEAGGQLVNEAPMIRGRVTQINGVPVEKATIGEEAQWAKRGDRGLSASATAPAEAQVVAGTWWSADYDGPPLVSMDAGIAKGFGIGVGQTVTLNVLGREITATVANLRRIDWSSMAMNFTFILNPNALKGAPQNYIATVVAPAGQESAVERAVGTLLPTVSAIRVKTALDQLRQFVDALAMALRAAALVALLSGILVLSAAIAASQRQRLTDMVLLKVLGARQRHLLLATLLEYGLVGAAASLAAGLLGTFAAWAVVAHFLRSEWQFSALPVLVLVVAAISVVALAGLFGTWRALKAPPRPQLQAD